MAVAEHGAGPTGGSGPAAQRGPDPAELLGRVQELSERVEQLDDPRARELAQDLVSAVITMYGDGLMRMMSIVTAAREAGATILDELSQDGAVASLLLIHDLYPVALRDRVLEALDTVRPYMESHGGDVELLALRGSCNGCAASRATLETAITQALAEHCPDLAGIEVAGVLEESGAVSGITGMALPMADGELARAAAGLGEEPACLPVIQQDPSLRASR
jgi:Fe-S cluster biogenesis protein NfuA